MEEVLLNPKEESQQLAAQIINFNFGFIQWSKNSFDNNFNINGKNNFSLTVRQFHILAVIHGWGVTTVSEMVEFTGISKSSLSLTITKLQKGGYVIKECHRSKDDGRKVYLSITPKGLEAVREANKRFMQSFYVFYKSLSDEKREDLKEGINKLNNVFMVKEEEFNET